MRRFQEIQAKQRSDEWFKARLGRLTGSVAADMLAKTKTGWSASRRNLALRLVLERVTGKSQDRGFVSPAMQDGIDREPLAFAAYEAMTGEVVQRSGFLSHLDCMAGCSLDGHIGDFEVLLSIKCRQPAAHLDFLKTGEIPKDALTQMIHEMWITGAREHHYFSYNPDFPSGLQSRLVTMPYLRPAVEQYEQDALAFLSECQVEYDALMTMNDPVGQLGTILGVK